MKTAIGNAFEEKRDCVVVTVALRNENINSYLTMDPRDPNITP